MKRIELWISGKVQGVAFRASLARFVLEQEFQVNGYVKNLPDGRVYVILEGNQAEIKKIEAWCQHGPPVAKVEHVKRVELAQEAPLLRFHIRN